MVPGFHCSSLEFHAPADLIEALSPLGYAALAIRPNRSGWHLDAPWCKAISDQIVAAAAEHQIAIIVDLDAPFYEDPRDFEGPSLASEDAQHSASAVSTLKRRIEQAAAVRPAVVTFSTGRRRPEASFAGHGRTGRQEAADEQTLEQLAGAIGSLLEHGRSVGVKLALRPVSEHAIATVAHFERFSQWLPPQAGLGLAADVGEMLLGGEFPIGARLARLQHRLSCVYLCEPDVQREYDQRFGRGDIDLKRVWEAITESGFAGPAIFRACGHGRAGLDLPREALAIVGLDR